MSSINKKARFYFYRNYQRYTGGHQKFRDYLAHTAALPNVECHLFTQNMCSTMPHLFSEVANVIVDKSYQPETADVVFLAGLDWEVYLPRQRSGQQVINLIQHVRHGDKSHPLHRFLKHEALRICVSEQVRQAILPYANGECITIPMGHEIPLVKSNKTLDLYILGKKNPKFASSVAKWAEQNGLSIHADLGLVSRDTVFHNFSKAKVSLVLPNPTEGFFLPGIEAMALSERVVVPDCVGNRGYCQPNTNITLCDYEQVACINAIKEALARIKRPVHGFEKFRGNRLARSYSMSAEEKNYQRLIENRILPKTFGSS